jgi:hypothetical protein
MEMNSMSTYLPMSGCNHIVFLLAQRKPVSGRDDGEIRP